MDFRTDPADPEGTGDLKNVRVVPVVAPSLSIASGIELKRMLPFLAVRPKGFKLFLARGFVPLPLSTNPMAFIYESEKIEQE